MLSCRQATRLVSESLDHPLTIWQRIVLRGHMVICIACRAYRRQVLQLNALFVAHYRRERDDEIAQEKSTQPALPPDTSQPTPSSAGLTSAADRLSPQARDRIKQNLRRDLGPS